MTPPKLVVAMPLVGYVHGPPFLGFMRAIAQGMCFWKRTHGWDADFGVVTVDRLPQDKARNALAKQLVEMEPDWVWWLDDDVLIPPDTLERLWEHREVAPMVSVPISIKTSPPEVMVYVFRGDNACRVLRSDWTGKYMAEAVGLGCLLMRGDVLAHVFNKRGGKPFHYADGKYGTEDLAFFEDCKEAGFGVAVDGGLDVKHVGLFPYPAQELQAKV